MQNPVQLGCAPTLIRSFAVRLYRDQLGGVLPPPPRSIYRRWIPKFTEAPVFERKLGLRAFRGYRAPCCVPTLGSMERLNSKGRSESPRYSKCPQWHPDRAERWLPKPAPWKENKLKDSAGMTEADEKQSEHDHHHDRFNEEGLGGVLAACPQRVLVAHRSVVNRWNALWS